jgi:cell division protein FtsW
MPQLVKTDRTLFYTTVAMTLFGLLMVYSASSVMAKLRWGSDTHFAVRQGVFVVTGLITMMIFKRLNYRWLQGAGVAFGAVGVVTILLILVYAIGTKHRWLSLGFGFNLQPSEFAKPAVVIFLAWFIAHRARAINDRHTVAPAFMAVGLVTLAVLAADLGTAVVIACTAAAVFYVAGLDRRYFIMLVVVGLVGGSVAIVSKPYRLVRVVQFFDPKYELIAKIDFNGSIMRYLKSSNASADANYQAEQSKIAVGAGGVTGRGVMDGRQKLMYLPEAHTDFIYAVISEELGLIGALGVIAGFCLILWRGLKTAFRTDDDFARYLALGLAVMIFVQALVNISVVLGLAPTKGIPLPMISHGGSSLLSTMMLLGMLMNVSETA